MADGTTSGTTTWGEKPSSEERTFAMLAHVAVLILPILGPLVIWLVKKDSSRFVAYHAVQAMIFQVIAWVIGGALCCGLGTVAGWVVGVMWALKANDGVWEGYPLIDRFGADA